MGMLVGLVSMIGAVPDLRAEEQNLHSEVPAIVAEHFERRGLDPTEILERLGPTR